MFEVNPRFSGGINLTIAADADFPAWLIEMRLGCPVRPALGKFTDNLMMSCYESAIFLTSDVAATGGMKQIRAGESTALFRDPVCEHAVASGPWAEV